MQDDEKSVSRAHRELTKLDQQLGVSVAQFTEVQIWYTRTIHVYVYCTRVLLLLQIRDSHSNTTEEFKGEQAKAADVENTLKGLIVKLQQQIKEQSRTKITYSVRERETVLHMWECLKWSCMFV